MKVLIVSIKKKFGIEDKVWRINKELITIYSYYDSNVKIIWKGVNRSIKKNFGIEVIKFSEK